MKKRTYTIARFIIGLLFMVKGMATNMSGQFNSLAGSLLPELPELFMIFAVIESVGGLLLFLKFRVKFIALVLALVTIAGSLLMETQFLPILENLVVITAVMLLVINGSGETIIEYMKTDIKHLPDYKTRL